jgi:Flp pilus assembly protein TadD
VFLTLGPTSSFIPIATEVGAERRMYLASAALIALAVVAFGAAMKRWPALPRRTAAIVLVVMASALTLRTVARNREYVSALTIAQTVLERWPSPNAHYLVGVELAAAGRPTEAMTHLQEASAGYPPALYYLGRELFAAGRFDEAAAALTRFVTAEPRVAAVRPARVMTARALDAAGRPGEAAAELRALITGSPADADVHALLANLYAAQQAFAEAIPHYREYLRVQPRDGDAWTGLGIALISEGRQLEAVEAFRRALDTQPDNSNFRANLERARGR